MNTVELKFFIEGYYDGNGQMKSVKNNQDGVSPTNEVETVTATGPAASSIKLVDRVTTGQVTGTTSNTIIASIKIPANTFTNGDLEALFYSYKNFTNGIYQIRFYFNTTNSLSGATLMANYFTTTSTQIFVPIRRIFWLTSNGLILNSRNTFPTSQLRDDTAVDGLTPNTYVFNNTVDQFCIVAITLANSADSVVNQFFKLIQTSI